MTDQFGREVAADGVRGRRENLFLAILAGIIAAVLGAILWTAVEVGLNMKIGFVAIAVGALVGFAIRVAGNGHSRIFGIIGAVLTFASCLGGEILAILYTASSPQQGVFDLLRRVDFVQMVTLIFSHMDPIGYLIYGIGIFEGYKLSVRK